MHVYTVYDIKEDAAESMGEPVYHIIRILWFVPKAAGRNIH